MRVILVFFILIFLLPISSAQNLILNSSFEENSTCPLGLIDKIFHWQAGSPIWPKVFDTCDYTLNKYFGVPVNLDSSLGYQLPRNGKAYAGINVFYTMPLVREYLKYEFQNRLIKDKEYCLTFYVNLTNYSRFAIANIGAYFTDSSLYCNSIPCILDYKPQVFNPPTNIISDTVEWTKISGCFTALGNEKYMLIGNFTQDSLVNKDTSRYIPSFDWSTFYYIDDVSLYSVEDTMPSTNDSVELVMPNVFSPNKDGINDVFVAKSENINKFKCKIYSRYGLLVAELMDVNAAWDGRNNSGEELPDGVYYYYVKAMDKKEKEINLKGFVSLVR
jgi:gliding motility-associated-like protein